MRKMDNNFKFERDNPNYDYEFASNNEWLDVHINLLFNELRDIQTAIYIFNIVDKEWNKRVHDKDVPEYSTVRTTLYESLVYRVVLGLNKIFADSKEYSLFKATNQVEQLFRSNKEILNTIQEIRYKLDNSVMVRVIRIYRDKFFAHLDKKSVMSYVRVDPTSVMNHIDKKELEEWLCLMRKLYLECFSKELPSESVMPSKEEVVYIFFWR